MEMKRKLRRIPQGSKARMKATRIVRNAKQRMQNALLKKTREEWTTKQAVKDISRQLRGEGFAPEPVDTHRRPQHPAQKRMVAALTAPAEPTLKGQYRRMCNAINALIAYCFIEEGRTLRRTGAAVTKSTSRLQKPVMESPVDAAVLSVFVKSEKEGPRRCLMCVGKACSLSPDDPQVSALINEFYTSSDLSRHFRQKHLKNLRPDKIHCHVYDMPLDHKMHLQSHAELVHGTISRDRM